MNESRRTNWTQAPATGLAMIGFWLLISSAMLLFESCFDRRNHNPSQPSLSDGELLTTCLIVLIPGMSALVGAAVLWRRSRRSIRIHEGSTTKAP